MNVVFSCISSRCISLFVVPLIIAICERLISEWDDTCVILGCRSKERGEQAIQDLQIAIGLEKCKDRLELLVIDTSSSSSVHEAAETLASKSDKELYGIINNAGVSLIFILCVDSRF